MKYRRHCGSLSSSMETIKEVNTIEELKKEIENYWKEEISLLEFQYACYDDRIQSHTYYVICTFEKSGRIVTGMSNETL